MPTVSRDVDYLRLILHQDSDGILLSRKRSPELAIELPEIQELRMLLGLLADRGIEKVRITGDDPALREDLTEVVELVASISGVREIALTTRGVGLAGRIAPLAREGLAAINFNLDTLQPKRFKQLYGSDQYRAAWRAVEEALAQGVTVKINTVVTQGFNDDEIEDFAELARTMPLHVRFVEWNTDSEALAPPADFLPAWEVFAAVPHALHPGQAPPRSGPAKLFEVDGSPGAIGFIDNVTDHFCSECRRIGLTDRGEIQSCIFGHGLSLLTQLRGAEGESGVREFIDRVVRRKSTLVSRLGNAPSPFLEATAEFALARGDAAAAYGAAAPPPPAS
ncbi:MAG: radical SAM protein [Candidatus Eisenbacteria bacterium]|nr:radical SAM protein [Candidatus Eisenbacteria bacterium]